MRVAVMGRSVRPGATGVGRHVASLIDSLSATLPSGALTVFLTRDANRRWQGAVREVRAPFPTPNEYVRAFWEQTVVPVQASRLGIDVYHCPNYLLPVTLTCRSVITVHDLTYLRSALHRLKSHLYLWALTALALRRADGIIAVSEFTRQAIERRYPQTRGRVTVIYQGLDPAFRPPTDDAVAAFRIRAGIEQPYVLFVGTIEPRKNLVRLIAAYEQAIQATQLPHHLFLVGARGWKNTALDKAIERSPLRNRIHQVGYALESDLPCWYAGASLFVYPSLEEGFGLPPLEAMTCGVPVVTSNCSALPEVVGDAALTVDPCNCQELASAIARVLTETTLAEQLASAGRQRAAAFSWTEAASKHITLYQTIAARGGRP